MEVQQYRLGIHGLTKGYSNSSRNPIAKVQVLEKVETPYLVCPSPPPPPPPLLHPPPPRGYSIYQSLKDNIVPGLSAHNL